MKRWLIPALAAVFFCSPAGFAQMPGTGAPAGVSAALTKLFGAVTAFSARSDVRVLDRDQKEKTSMSINFALLDNKVRIEADTAQVKSKELPALAAAGMKQLNMDRVVTVVRPDKKTTYVIFPGVQSYFTTPLSAAEAGAMIKDQKLEETALGHETIDGHPCVKNRVTLADDQGAKTEVTVWNATDLKDFPVQILAKDKDDTIITRYKQIQFAKPDAKGFEVPEGYSEYDSPQSLTQAVMIKMLTGSGQ